mmetsp:Transcript_5301/g.11611  ORF Transcript_5301/g.11611 Transcript_5301/m.11611 type:complete len:89 (-) Transcript_5301:637-903(-)
MALHSIHHVGFRKDVIAEQLGRFRCVGRDYDVRLGDGEFEEQSLFGGHAEPSTLVCEPALEIDDLYIYIDRVHETVCELLGVKSQAWY